MTRIKIANILLIAGLGILLLGTCWFGFKAHQSAKAQQEIKQDYSLLNSVTFGIFSVDEWRERLSEVINRQINCYSITPEQQRDIQAAVEKELHGLIAKTVAKMNKPQKSIGGKLKKMAFNALVDSDALQQQVKPFATTIVQKIASPGSQARLKDIATSKLNQLENQTYDNTNEANTKVTKYIYQKYHVSDPARFDAVVKDHLHIIWNRTVGYAFAMLTCVLAALALWWFTRKNVEMQTMLVIMALLFAAVMLAVGLTMPVIEVDARIQALNLKLLGDTVAFKNQVLFFQSKSIWGIIITLLSQHKPDSITVGILILLFIVILPFLRLTAKGIRLFVRDNKVINYLAFEAGKWDMADVLIVGILMTFIGLNGILKSQLSNLNMHNDTLTINTVNFTSLQPGYFVFFGYVVFEFVLSYVLKKTTPDYVKPVRGRRKAKVSEAG